MQINSSGISDLANTTFSTTIVESRIGTKYIDWQGDGSILLKNTVKLSGSGIRAMNNLKYITDDWLYVDTLSAFGTSGSFTVPSGVTRMIVMLAGGGGGGSGGFSYSVTTGWGDTKWTNTYSSPGRFGGNGGVGIKKLDVTPSSSFSFTIGAGGGGGASGGNGSAGGASSLSYGTYSMSCTGGGAGTVGQYGVYGANGVATGADSDFTGNYSGYTSKLQLLQGGVASSIYNFQMSFLTSVYNTMIGQSASIWTASRTAIAYNPSGLYAMGALGDGSPTSGSGIGNGAVGGGVFFLYKAP